MTAPAEPMLEPGGVYRTRDLARWSANAPRLAARLVRDGKLVPLAHGLFAAPRRSRFGDVPPTDEALLHAFLDGEPFVFTGPERWNALGLGTTAVFATPLVYNTKRSGQFTFGSRRFLLRRVAFPETPSPEWFVVDLFENAEQAAAAREDLARALQAALRAGKFDGNRLASLAARYGSRRTQAFINAARAPVDVGPPSLATPLSANSLAVANGRAPVDVGPPSLATPLSANSLAVANGRARR